LWLAQLNIWHTYTRNVTDYNALKDRVPYKSFYGDFEGKRNHTPSFGYFRKRYPAPNLSSHISSGEYACPATMQKITCNYMYSTFD
jgi:hypothetical protein